MATSTVSARRTRRGPNSILLKAMMAGTGLFFVLYLLVHMYGNLLILGGREGFDEYAHHIRTFGEGMIPYGGVLWVARIALLAALIGHVWSGVALWRRAGQARSTRYVGSKTTYGNFYAPAMRWGGLAILLFVVFHILHFTTQTVTVAGEHESPAARVITSFQVWWAVLIYLAAMIAVALHLFHGIWAACMTLGLNTSVQRAKLIRTVSIVLTAIIAVGFLIPPFAILSGIVD